MLSFTNCSTVHTDRPDLTSKLKTRKHPLKRKLILNKKDQNEMIHSQQPASIAYYGANCRPIE